MDLPPCNCRHCNVCQMWRALHGLAVSKPTPTPVLDGMKEKVKREKPDLFSSVIN